MIDQSPSTANSSSVESHRVRLIRLAVANREWLQWHIEDMCSAIPRLAFMPLMHLVKSQTDGQVDKESLWKLIPIALDRMSDEQFSSLRAVVLQLLEAPVGDDEPE